MTARDYPKYERPLPAVGDRIRMFAGPSNPNNWMCAGEVRAIVDDRAIVVKRWFPVKRFHGYLVIDQLGWSIQAYVHLPKTGDPIRLPNSWRHLEGVPLEGPPPL